MIKRILISAILMLNAPCSLLAQEGLKGKTVIWLGTSIPGLSTYPRQACENLGMTCINRAISTSYMFQGKSEPPFQQWSGFSLTLSSDEKEEIYRPYVEDGTVAESLLDYWKWTSYDQRVLPHLNDADYVIVDHGYNDSKVIEQDYLLGEENIDWSSEDRSTFIGSFNHLYRRLKEEKPDIKIIIGGYFQNQCTILNAKTGLYVSKVSEWIARHYDIPLLDVWNYTDIPDGYAPNSSHYLAELNEKYGTGFKPWSQDAEGNITYFQMFCPDGVHPHTDPTGHSNHVLDSIFTFLLDARLPRIVEPEPLPQLMFNEVMQSNIDQLMVSHNFPDSWVELHNTTSKTVNLRNWYIGTDRDFDTAYQILHTVSIAPHGYGMLYCDKRDDHYIHTDFRLESTSKGHLYLWNSAGELIDSLSYPKMPAPNVAYGRMSDGTWVHEIVATPGAANVERTSDLLLPEPVFSHKGQLFDMGKAFDLTISIPAVDAMPEDTRLYVTTDGSMPNSQSPDYAIDQPVTLHIDHTTVVRARLLSAQALSGMPVTHSYIFHPRATLLSILSLTTDSCYLYSNDEGILVGDTWTSNIYKDWTRPINIEYFDPDSAAATINQIAETKTHGVGSLLYSQKSMNFKANKRFGKKKFDTGNFWPDKPEVSKSKTFCIRNGGNRCIDTRFEDAFAQLLFGQHVDSLQYLSYRPVIVYINGEYKGVFGLRERSHKSWVESNLGIDEDNISIVEGFYSSSTLYDEVRQIIDDPSSTYADFARLLDLPLFIDYLCAEAYATNTDYPHNNVWLWCDYTEADDPFHPLLKDLDYLSTTTRSNWFNLMLNRGLEHYSVVNADSHKLFIRLFEMEEFREAFLDRMQTYLGDFCKPSVTLPMIHQMRDDIDAELAPTFSLMTEGVTYQDFESKYDERLVPYCEQWPMYLYECMGKTFDLGPVIPATVMAQTPISLNGIRLTEGDFEGACFGNRRLVLNTGNDDYGWLLTIEDEHGGTQTVSYLNKEIEYIPDASISDNYHLYFVPATLQSLSISTPMADARDAKQYYDLYGRRLPNAVQGICIIRSEDKTQISIR